MYRRGNCGLWTLKAMLTGFELTSGLKVNFSKSCLLGINVSGDFMEMACNFFNCTEGTLPFKYMGLQIGANPRRMSTSQQTYFLNYACHS